MILKSLVLGVNFVARLYLQYKRMVIRNVYIFSIVEISNYLA